MIKPITEKIKLTFGDEAESVLNVLNYANEKHKGMLRDDGSPYINHSIRVAELVIKYKKSKNASMIYKGSLLHDVIEDTYSSYRELSELFGEPVASLVMELSTAKYATHCFGKADYLSRKMQNMTPYALNIKLCDRLDNLQHLKACTPEKQTRTINDTKVIISYLLKNRELTQSQLAVIEDINKEIAKFENNK